MTTTTQKKKRKPLTAAQRKQVIANLAKARAVKAANLAKAKATKASAKYRRMPNASASMPLNTTKVSNRRTHAEVLKLEKRDKQNKADGLTAEESAKILGVSLGYVYNMRTRAKARKAKARRTKTRPSKTTTRKTTTWKTATRKPRAGQNGVITVDIGHANRAALSKFCKDTGANYSQIVPIMVRDWLKSDRAKKILTTGKALKLNPDLAAIFLNHQN